MNGILHMLFSIGFTEDQLVGFTHQQLLEELLNQKEVKPTHLKMLAVSKLVGNDMEKHRDFPHDKYKNKKSALKHIIPLYFQVYNKSVKLQHR